ncbi:MAG TPA: pseudaminic acid cytidylyltransferase [Rhizomicrobium sp.]|nr:pseudaminic acid cytidylyltransferase [Rhizomicrobium sp.]
MNLAIIPARGGSKRIPRKNIRPFRGRPIIAWSIAAARDSGVFDEVMVSTDDDEIAAVAGAHGASVPFRRSPETADDHATTAAVLNEVLLRYRSLGVNPQFACCLYATAPLVRPQDLRDGLRLLREGRFDVILPVVQFSSSIWRSLKRDDDGRIVPNWPENRHARSQDLPPAWHDAGQWYWFDVARFLESGLLWGENTGSVVLPESRVQDIDNEEDWTFAELKHQKLFG